MLLSEQSVSLALEVHLQTLGAGQKGGLLSREALSEALACSSLITVLVQTMGDAALQPLEPTLRYDYSSAGTPLCKCRCHLRKYLGARGFCIDMHTSSKLL